LSIAWQGMVLAYDLLVYKYKIHFCHMMLFQVVIEKCENYLAKHYS